MSDALPIDGDLLPWILLTCGLVVAFRGQRLVRVAIAVAGFAVGYLLVEALAPDLDQVVQVVAGIVAGVVGSVIAFRSLRFMTRLSGGVLLGLAAAPVTENALDVDAAGWIGFAAGLIAGFVLVGAVFEVGIRIATAVGGGALVAESLQSLAPDWDDTYRFVAAVAVAVLGFMAQSRTSPVP